ncbi:hypothetical protein KR044_004708, partial [Drosophila immigrans]
ILFHILRCNFPKTAYGTSLIVTKPPFVRSRYSLRWRKTTTTMAPSTTGRVMELATSTQHPVSKLGTSTASPDYDYYGTGEAADNLVHK